MKIIAGTLKGKNFYMPSGIRPTQDVVRKAIFDTIGNDLKGFSLLDLFAGSGAVGLEAISRGAQKVIFIEKNMHCADTINENLKALGADQHDYGEYAYFVMNADAFAAAKGLHRRKETFDIIFADPPFGADLAKKILKDLVGYDIVHRNSLLIIQHEKREILPESSGRFLRVRERKYGSSRISIYQSE